MNRTRPGEAGVPALGHAGDPADGE